MKFGTPLYFILFISLIPFLVIYFLKPTFKNKEISSTYIWKKSLQYGKTKKGIQINNIFSLLIQILLIVAIVLMAVTPKIFAKSGSLKERVIVIDDNAYMMAKVDDETRLERAINEAKKCAQTAIGNKEKVTVGTINERNRLLVIAENDLTKINEKLDGLKCSYSQTSINDAIVDIKKKLDVETSKKISLFSVGSYQNLEEIDYMDVSSDEEFNLSIRGFRKKQVNNYYTFDVDLVSSGASKQIEIKLVVLGANSEKRQIVKKIQASLVEDEHTTISIDDLGVYEFDEATVTIKATDGQEDSIQFDNTAIISHGRPEAVKIQYYSTKPNNFMQGSLRALRNLYADTFDFQITEPSQVSEIKTDGCDYYIFEHYVPRELPRDGKVLLLNPNEIARENAEYLGVSLGRERKGKNTLEGGEPHSITRRVNFSKMSVTSYHPLILSDDVISLASANNECVLALSKNKDVVIATLNLHNSDLAVLLDFPILMNNIFNFFMPRTINLNEEYYIGDKIKLNSRFDDIQLEIDGETKEINKQEEIELDKLDVYIIKEKKGSYENVYKIMPRLRNESLDIKQITSLKNGVGKVKEPVKKETDIFIILAGIIVGLIFVERLLTIRKRG